MNRILLSVALAAALPLFGQQTTSHDASLVVATINGETITAAKLDQLWNRMSEKDRKQYERAGGKMAFLGNYVRTRLLLQQAIANGFDKKPEVQAELEAAKESALFDLYVRDVLSTSVVGEEEMHKFYEEHRADFAIPERAKVRQILIKTDTRSPERARELISDVMTELFGARTQIAASTGSEDKAKFTIAFAKAAAKYSEDASAASGGDLGWVDRSMLGSELGDVAFRVRPGMMSGIVQSPQGMHLIYVEDQTPAGTESYDSARPAIREYLLGRNAQRVLEAINKAAVDLRSSAKIEVFPENVH